MRDRETERHRDRETERQRDRETERQRDRETERQRDRETERQRYCSFKAVKIIVFWSTTKRFILMTFFEKYDKIDSFCKITKN